MGNPGTAISLVKMSRDAGIVRQIEEFYDTRLCSWKEDDIEDLAKAHSSLQLGAAQDDIVVEYADYIIGGKASSAKASDHDWTA
jgi:hypothetical protein